jgi:acetolactate synthase-1/2/3 large subunit
MTSIKQTAAVRMADYLAAFIRAQGVKTVFMVSGGGAMFLNDAIAQAEDLDYVPHHNEQACTIAAEAYSRVNEKLGVAMVTTGPGATNAITGVAGAWIESVPLLVISGQVKRADMMGDSGVRQKGPQEVNIVAMVSPITKYAVTVMDPLQIRYELEKAVYLATTGRKGPVWIDVPLDVQAAPVMPSELVGYKPPPDVQPSDYRQEARQVLQLLQQSRRPVILAGHGIRLSGAAKAFAELYRILGVPVLTTWNAMDLIASDDPLAAGKPGTVALRAPNFVVQNCDLLISIGARLDNVVTAHNPANFGRQAKKVLVDIDETEIGKFAHSIDVAVQADAKDFIETLLAEAETAELNSFPEWLSRCVHWKKKFTINDGAPFPQSGEISHFHMMDSLSRHIPQDTLVVTGSSGLGIESFYTAFLNKTGQRVFLTSGLGAMGYGVPAMIGASQVNKGRKLVGVESDGSLQMNLQELLTLKATNIPLTLFIIDNAGYASIRNTQRNYFDGRYIGTGPEAKLWLPDIVKLAGSLGISASSVSDASGLDAAVAGALGTEGLHILVVKVKKDEALWPKCAAIPQADGSMLSMPLEDMSPLLSIEELEAEMMVPLLPTSYLARGLR